MDLGVGFTGTGLSHTHACRISRPMGRTLLVASSFFEERRRKKKKEEESRRKKKKEDSLPGVSGECDTWALDRIFPKQHIDDRCRRVPVEDLNATTAKPKLRERERERERTIRHSGCK